MSDLIPSVSGSEFPGEGKQTIIEAASIPSGSDPGSPGDERQHDEQIDFIDRKQDRPCAPAAR